MSTEILESIVCDSTQNHKGIRSMRIQDFPRPRPRGRPDVKEQSPAHVASTRMQKQPDDSISRQTGRRFDSRRHDNDFCGGVVRLFAMNFCWTI